LGVDFEIDRIAGAAAAEQGTLQRFRYQVHAKGVVANDADSQAAAVEPDKAFGKQIGISAECASF